MKLLVLNNMVPFLRGGAEKLADSLVKNLRAQGHEAEVLRVPFRWEPAQRVYDELLACRLMRLYNVDRVIGLKFPAYLIPHPHKTLWVVHQFRQAYDLLDAGQSHLPSDETGRNLRTCIASADAECFAHANQIHCISHVVQKRLKHYSGVQGHVLYPPLDDADKFHPLPRERYIFCGGRVNAAKRQMLLIQAMRYVRSDLRLIITGPPDSPADGQQLEQLVQRLALQERVQLELGFASRDRIADRVNRAWACACIPRDEDYGYVTLEAFYSGRPVITTTDAGGVLEFVTDGETGRVVMAEARALARAIDELAENREQTERWGQAARQLIHERNINWPETITRLVA